MDRDADRLARHHAQRLHCRKGCSGCCVDGITVFEVEADRIRRNHADLLAAGEPHRAGACAFLDDESACRIYEDRPYVCRTQGLPLRWFDEVDGERVEYRDICPLNEEGPPLEELPAAECWTIGPAESRLAELQSRADRTGSRVELRDLFASSA